MYITTKQKRILVAILLGAIIVTAAILLKTDTQTKTNETQEVAVVNNVIKRKPIKTLDGNNNGVPDWQETIIKNEALQVASATSTYEAPDTLTEKFALDFFQDMVNSKQYGAFGADTEELVQKASNELAQEAQDELITQKDINISSNNSIKALNQYGEAVARIIFIYEETTSESEISVLEKALRSKNPESLKVLEKKITYYENILRETKKLHTPSLLTYEHLRLLNSYQAILNDIKAMKDAFDDPMKALLRIKRYKDDVQGLNQSIIDVYTTLLNNGASWDNNSIVFSLIGVSDDTL